MLSDKLQKSKQVGNSIDLPIPVESVVQTLHLNRSKFEEKKNMRQHKLPHLHIRPWNQITSKWTILYINSPTNCASIAPKIQQCPSFNYTIITIYDPWNYYPFLSVFDCNKTISIGIFSTDISVVVWIGNFCHRFFGIFKRIYRNSSFNLTFFSTLRVWFW